MYRRFRLYLSCALNHFFLSCICTYKFVVKLEDDLKSNLMRWACNDRLHDIHFVTLRFADQKRNMALVTLLAAGIYLASLANALAVTHSSKDSGPGSPTIDLGYSMYRGVRLPGGVDQFLGMRYAQAPVGGLRFRAPREPEYKYEEQDASQVGYVPNILRSVTILKLGLTRPALL
jgi:hypothetical protein